MGDYVDKLAGAILLVIGIVLFVVSLVYMFPIPDNIRIPLILGILAAIAIEFIKDWETFIDKVFKFSLTLIVLSLIFLTLFVYLGLAELAKPLIILALASIVLFVGAYITKKA